MNGPKVPKSPEAVRAYVERVAAHRHWKLNGDPELTPFLVEGLGRNFNEKGFFLCPCRDSHGDKTKDGDIACPCVYAEEDIKEFGQCFCGLFLDPDKKDTEVCSIPERRPENKFPQ